MKLATLIIIIAWASQYSPGVMERVIEHRQTPGYAEIDLPANLPETDGFVAVADCGRIGEVIWLMPIGANRLKSFLVADCAVRNDSDGTLTWMAARNIAVEVDYETAARWGTVGRLIRITSLERPRLER